jgi:hypothetical protein
MQEWIYHGIAFILYAMAGIALLGTATSDLAILKKKTYMAASVRNRLQIYTAWHWMIK